MSKASVWAVSAGLLVCVVVTTLVDVALHVIGVYPPMPEPLTDALALVATAYRIPIGVGAAWLTARLAPARPLKHAVVLGCVGTLVAVAGIVATWNRGLGPRWYPIALAVLAVPQCWAGGKLFELRPAKRPAAAAPAA
jgi:hypothetical protein